MRLLILTGFSSGLGEAIHNLLISKNSQDELIFLGRKTGKSKKNASYFHADFSDKECQWLNNLVIDDKIQEIVLINNAGVILPIGKLSEFNIDEVERNIYINFVSPIKLIVKLAKLSSRLKIINISSGAADNPIHCWAPYCAAKSGMKSFLNVVELEDGISIFNVDPGVLDTNMQEEIRNHSQKCKNLEYFVGLKEDQKLRKASDAANEIYRDYIQ